MTRLVFLKLGGSLITDKTRPYTPRPEKLADLATQIAAARREDPELRMVLGHGSGSFGHEAAAQHWSVERVLNNAGWLGFAEVWYQASALNRLVMAALHDAGIAAIAFPPSACVQAEDGTIGVWDTSTIQAALSTGLLPVIYGDVAFDSLLGGSILSTETLFFTLAHRLHPQRILLAGLEAGVWANFPARTQLHAEITPEIFREAAAGLCGAAGADVTGGMKSKVEEMLSLVQFFADIEILIFSGEEPDNVHRALLGERLGTLIHR